jgi:hypothetical protein
MEDAFLDWEDKCQSSVKLAGGTGSQTVWPGPGVSASVMRLPEGQVWVLDTQPQLVA